MKTMAPIPQRRKSVQGRKLFAMREKHGLSQQAAADLIGVSVTAWHKWENLGANISRSHRILIEVLDDDPKRLGHLGQRVS
jgi:DNA-binding transcriptional regulator YiaG